jgi:hypothetical protein
MALFGASLRLTPTGLTRRIAPGGSLAPGRRSTAPVQRDHLGYWCNMRAIGFVPTIAVTRFSLDAVRWSVVRPHAAVDGRAQPVHLATKAFDAAVTYLGVG